VAVRSWQDPAAAGRRCRRVVALADDGGLVRADIKLFPRRPPSPSSTASPCTMRPTSLPHAPVAVNSWAAMRRPRRLDVRGIHYLLRMSSGAVRMTVEEDPAVPAVPRPSPRRRHPVRRRPPPSDGTTSARFRNGSWSHEAKTYVHRDPSTAIAEWGRTMVEVAPPARARPGTARRPAAPPAAAPARPRRGRTTPRTPASAAAPPTPSRGGAPSSDRRCGWPGRSPPPPRSASAPRSRARRSAPARPGAAWGWPASP
jgi:hypothetical protein